MIERYSRPAMKKVWSEENKYRKWLQVELAACEAWTEEGVIPQEDMGLLRSANYNHTRMMEIFETTRHDVTAFLSSITEGIGQEGRWLHLGLTSSDMLDTALGLQLGEAGAILLGDLDEALGALKLQAIAHKNTIMMGRTHGVHAEPITFGLKLALWREEMDRHRDRLAEARVGVAVGKCSGVVGTYATLTPELEERICGLLGLRPAPTSNQIIQRDRHAHLITTLALVAASLEKFATEIRHLQRTEVREVEEPFGEGQTGSSAMPHKRNPELSERVCGLARLIRGHAITALENVALWHERDISHSSTERLIIPDSCLALDYILDLFAGVLRGMRVYPDRMWTNMESTKGLLFSQRALLALVEKGMSREESYELIQRHAHYAWDNDQDFRELLRNDVNVSALLPGDEMEELFDYGYYLRHLNAIFNRLGLDQSECTI